MDEINNLYHRAGGGTLIYPNSVNLIEIRRNTLLKRKIITDVNLASVLNEIINVYKLLKHITYILIFFSDLKLPKTPHNRVMF